MKNLLISSDIEVFIYDRVGLLINASVLLRSNVLYRGYLISPDGWSVKMSIPPFKNSPMGLFYNIRRGLVALRQFMKEVYKDSFTIKLKTYEKVDKVIKIREFVSRNSICMRDILEPVDVETNVLFSKTKLNVTCVPKIPLTIENKLRTTVGRFYRLLEPGLPHVEYVGLPQKIGSTIGSKCLRTLPLIIVSILLYISLKQIR